MNVNLKGLAADAWFNEIPLDDPYAPCPCGCGKKWKFIKADYEEHEARFIKAFILNETK